MKSKWKNPVIKRVISFMLVFAMCLTLVPDLAMAAGSAEYYNCGRIRCNDWQIGSYQGSGHHPDDAVRRMISAVPLTGMVIR